MSYWFFLSYARLDKDDHLAQFHEDLCRQILLQKFMAPNQVGFFDGDAIQVGDPWKPALSHALRTSRVLVCLCSPAYSNSDYCGREFQVFAERQEAFNNNHSKRAVADGQPARVVFPILWGPPRNEFPDVIKALQYTDDEFPADYAKDGLAYLMSRKGQADDYTRFVRVLATRLVDAGDRYAMPELASLRPLTEVVPPFPQTAVAPAAGGMAPTGRRYAKFLFVAAPGEELGGVKNAVEGCRGGGDWQPYWPDDEDPVFLLAQEAATKLKLFFHELPLSDRLETHLKEAHDNKEIVIIIVDAWSIRLERYQKMIKPYDGITSLNCALLVPWNEADPETVRERVSLRTAIQQTFSYKTRVDQGIYFQDAIPSSSSLRKDLLNTMSQIRSDIINAVMASTQPNAVVRSEGLARDAERRGVPSLTQPPVVQVPTGA